MFIQSVNMNFTPSVLQRKKDVNFCGLMHIDKSNGNINDSGFFRDYETLKNAVEHIKCEFPEGANILDYGCSTGEETISIKILAPESKYKVIGYDNSADAIRLGKRGVYTLFSSWMDSFLLPIKAQLNSCLHNGTFSEDLPYANELRKKFHSVMQEIPASPQYHDINNKTNYKSIKYNSIDSFVEKFYQIKEEFRNQIDLRLGNFINVGKYKGEKPVGGVFFRNAIYHLCENNINEVFNYDAKIGNFKNKNLLMEYLVNEIHKTISENGIFVIGNHIKEHLYWADDATPTEDKIAFEKTPFFNERLCSHVKHRRKECYKVSPLEKALLKDGRFEPIKISDVKFGGKIMRLPVIWKKIRG